MKRSPLLILLLLLGSAAMATDPAPSTTAKEHDGTGLVYRHPLRPEVYETASHLFTRYSDGTASLQLVARTDGSALATWVQPPGDLNCDWALSVEVSSNVSGIRARTVPGVLSYSSADKSFTLRWGSTGEGRDAYTWRYKPVREATLNAMIRGDELPSA